MKTLIEFYKENKKGFFGACILFIFLEILIATIKKYPITDLFIGLLISIPLIFFMGYGIWIFIGGNK